MSVRVIVLPSLPSPPRGTVKFHISKERPNTFQNSSSPKKVRSNTKAGTLTTFHPEQIFVFHFMLCRELPASPHKGDVSSLIRVGHCGEAPVPAISYSVTTGWHFSNGAGRTLVGTEISESLTWHQACYILLWTTARNHLLIFTFLILCWLKKKKKGNNLVLSFLPVLIPKVKMQGTHTSSNLLFQALILYTQVYIQKALICTQQNRFRMCRSYCSLSSPT